MKNEKMVNSTPPPSFVSSKRLCRLLCVFVCTVFAFALVGCGDSYTDEINDLRNEIAELRAEIETLHSFTPMLEMGETATIYSNGLPLLKVTYLSISGYPNFKIENISTAPLPLDYVAVFCGINNETRSNARSLDQILLPNDSVIYSPTISVSDYNYILVGFATAQHSYGTGFYQSSIGVIPTAIFRIHPAN